MKQLINHSSLETPEEPAEAAGRWLRKSFRNSDEGAPGRDPGAMSGTVGEGILATEYRWAG